MGSLSRLLEDWQSGNATGLRPDVIGDDAGVRFLHLPPGTIAQWESSAFATQRLKVRVLLVPLVSCFMEP